MLRTATHSCPEEAVEPIRTNIPGFGEVYLEQIISGLSFEGWIGICQEKKEQKCDPGRSTDLWKYSWQRELQVVQDGGAWWDLSVHWDVTAKAPEAHQNTFLMVVLCRVTHIYLCFYFTKIKIMPPITPSHCFFIMNIYGRQRKTPIHTKRATGVCVLCPVERLTCIWAICKPDWDNRTQGWLGMGDIKGWRRNGSLVHMSLMPGRSSGNRPRNLYSFQEQRTQCIKLPTQFCDLPLWHSWSTWISYILQRPHKCLWQPLKCHSAGSCVREDIYSIGCGYSSLSLFRPQCAAWRSNLISLLLANGRWSLSVEGKNRWMSLMESWFAQAITRMLTYPWTAFLVSNLPGGKTLQPWLWSDLRNGKGGVRVILINKVLP